MCFSFKMQTLIAIAFIAGYLLIILEQVIRLNKTATALFLGMALWILWSFSGQSQEEIHTALAGHLMEIAEIVFFLLGAMLIVEVIDEVQGFEILTSRIRTRSKRTLFWILGTIGFLLSPILDNLTTAIVMMTVVKKLVTDSKERFIFGGLIIIAVNAGGAWSPMGDVTTTMLWIGGQVTALGLVKKLILPSLICYLLPLFLLTPLLKGRLPVTRKRAVSKGAPSLWVLLIGITGMAFVPVLKSLTHLPPYLGMLLVASILWAVIELFLKKNSSLTDTSAVENALKRIDVSSVLFFVGILAAVGALHSSGILHNLANGLTQTVGHPSLIVLSLGFLSSVLDNVPLVAGTMAMYPTTQFPVDHSFWTFLAYCAGTGGSLLIIGSAAGVAVMGIQKISFIWYLRKISWAALLGYLAGAAAYYLLSL